MKHRAPSEDEKRLFRKSVERSSPHAVLKPKAKKAAAKSPGGGLDGHTKARLKRGAGQPQARLDLHGMTQAAAHRALFAFLQRAHENSLRLVLVITGKGNPEKQAAVWTLSDHGVLKEMVPRWLGESDFAALVSGSAPAHVRHGGDGALYVYLRK